MKCLVYVLNETKLLSTLLAEFSAVGISGCTILDSEGVGRELVKRHDVFEMMFGSLRNMLKPSLESNKTMLMVLPDEQVETAVNAIEKVVGDLSGSGTGLAFTVSLDFVKGLKV